MEKFEKFQSEIIKTIDSKKKSNRYLNMKENVYNLLSNLLTDQTLRDKVGVNRLFVSSLINRYQKFETTKDLRF